MRYCFCILFFVSILGLISACKKDNSPEQYSPSGIFTTVWNDFDKNYPYFVLKNIDWDSVYQVYYPEINDNMPSEELFNTVGQMLLTLKDYHVAVASTYGTYHFSKRDQYPENPPHNAEKYLDKVYLENSKVLFGSNKDENYFYLRIKTFSGTVSEFSEAVSCLDSLEKSGELILDIRDNSGGNELNGRAFAGRFVQTKTLYRYYRIRNGSEWDDYTDWEPGYFLSSNPLLYNKRIILLTNRGVYSSSELFTLMMQTYPGLIIVGDTTGAASANPSRKNLPNGWQYWRSTWQAASLNYTLIEDNGISPDHYVLMTQNSINTGKDLILEKAIDLLSTEK